MSTRKIHHWIFESPLAIRSLKCTADRDTVKGRRWRPVFGKNRAEYLYIPFTRVFGVLQESNTLSQMGSI